MQIEQYLKMDAMEMAKQIDKNKVSPQQLIELSFEQLLNVNETLNAVSSTRKEKALDELERMGTSQDKHSPFYGVPFYLKGTQSLRGEPLTSGSVLLKDNIAQVTSHFSQRLRDAGFSCLGHSTVPEFALKNITEPKLHGVTRNPWNQDYSTGGSSGGSAALVASGVVPVAGASDGGGSIRIPASFTGLFGLKPTRGRTPVGPGIGRQWHGAAIDFVLSRTVRDSAYLLDLLQVIQPEAAFQTPLYEKGYLNTLDTEFQKPLTIGFTTESPVKTAVSGEAKQAVHNIVTWLERKGHHVVEKEPDIDGIQLMRDYYLMNSGEISAFIYQLERETGREITAHDVEIETWLLNRAGQSVSAREFTMSLASWDQAAAIMAKFHETYDLYVTPATADSAPKIGELTHTKEDEAYYLRQIEGKHKKDQQELIYDMFLPSLAYTPFTQLANLTGQPAMSVPTHLTKKGLPLGVQFMAGKGKEHILLQLANQLEQSDLWVGLKGNPYFTSQ